MNRRKLLGIAADRMLPLASICLFFGVLNAPLFELRGFDEFGLDSVSEWTGPMVRWTLFASLGSLLLPFRAPVRWFMALSAGLLVSPLVGLVSEASALAASMSSDQEVRPFDLIEIRVGLRCMIAGTATCLLDALIWAATTVRMRRRSADHGEAGPPRSRA
ncbi:hypothetical protein [Haloferula sp. A504]|uniref:hypothetical protein n=1 Tax=Haloferula sp. A504 TaxID=3373601 RepID=UPI0031C289BB|nr:hypothetical protein [Verrucomicrobiaceae bacterium E54]